VFTKLVQFVIAVVLTLLLAWLLQWAMTKLGAAEMVQTVVWIVFALIVLLGIAGLLGHGPLAGKLE